MLGRVEDETEIVMVVEAEVGVEERSSLKEVEIIIIAHAIAANQHLQ